MNKYLWKIECTSAPPVLRYCKKCGEKTEFVSSGLFRVNAQKKSLDVWLIYKCVHCDTTWNATVFSRISPQSLPLELLERFHGNDGELADQYALNIDFLHRNGVDVGAPDYAVMGDDISLDEPAELTIQSPCPMPVKVSSILRSKLGLSQNEYIKAIESGRIRALPEQDLKKCRLNSGIKLAICP